MNADASTTQASMAALSCVCVCVCVCVCGVLFGAVCDFYKGLIVLTCYALPKLSLSVFVV